MIKLILGGLSLWGAWESYQGTSSKTAKIIMILFA